MNVRVVCLFFLVFMVSALAQSDQKYPTKFDYLSLDTILRNQRLLKSYYRCLVDEGPCTQEGNELRKRFPDALKTKCKKCNEMQKKNARKVIEYVQKYKPDMWKGVLKKYDPTGELTKHILEPGFLG